MLGEIAGAVSTSDVSRGGGGGNMMREGEKAGWVHHQTVGNPPHVHG